MSQQKSLTIGIFDSGIGGLTVFKAVADRFPNANILYLGDTARLPYGSKSPETIARYLGQNVNFLLQKNVDLVIVACNSASTVIDHQSFSIPVHGVIVPGSNKALQVSQSKRIGVMATKATVATGSYSRTIKSLEANAQVTEIACPLLVPMVEEAMIDDPVTEQMIRRYVGPLLDKKVDTIILGCTHYPILKQQIKKIVGNEIQLVDSADSMPQLLEHLDFESQARREFFLTDVSQSFLKLARFILGTTDITLQHVNI